MEIRTIPLLALAGATALLTAASCGGTLPEQDPLSGLQYHAEADPDEGAAAAEQDRRSAESRQDEGNPMQSGNIQCYDPKVLDPDSGGESLHVLPTCFTVAPPTDQDQADDAEAEAEAVRDEEARHRAVAAAIQDAEHWACAGMSDEEKKHSPFFHREAIVRVEEVKVDGERRGARVHFAKVRGLEVGRLRRAIHCHEARAAAMGYDPQAMSYCPLMVAPTSTTVKDMGRTIAVTIVARGNWEIATVLARAQSLKMARR